MYVQHPCVFMYVCMYVVLFLILVILPFTQNVNP